MLVVMTGLGAVVVTVGCDDRGLGAVVVVVVSCDDGTRGCRCYCCYWL